MSELGQCTTLPVARFSKIGAYLDAGDLGDILLPARSVPRRCEIGQRLDVFLYLDSEDRPIATTQKPYAAVGQAAWLRVVDVTPVGAFLDWGLPKDLLCPFSEQQRRMTEGQSYLVYVCFEADRQRIIASSKISRFIEQGPGDLRPQQAVDVFVAERTDLGCKVIINDRYWGMLYENEVFRTLRRGQRLPGVVKKIRRDGKIDCALQSAGYQKVHDTSWNLLEALHARNGFLPITDKSPPEEIYTVVGVSKKTFKKAVGALYKQRMITIESAGIRLNDS